MSQSGSRESVEQEMFGEFQEQMTLPATGTDGAPAAASLQQIAAERLASHRRRRSAEQLQAEKQAAERTAQLEQRRTRGTGSRVRERVAAHYQQQLSYSEFLAVEAERAAQKAAEDAEAAATAAREAAEAQARLMEELRQQAIEALAVRVPRPSLEAPTVNTPMLRADSRLAEELRELDEELAFRLAPELPAHIPAESLPGNIIAFPRPIVAPRKARPRLAEGPLREDVLPVGDSSQLRIFEVELEQISTQPEPAAAEGVQPAWQSVAMDAPVPLRVPRSHVNAQIEHVQPLHTAVLERRALSVALDTVLILAGWTAGCTLAAWIAGNALANVELKSLVLGAGAMLFMLTAGYQALFLLFNDQTPGMRLARLGFCTFSDENPKRHELRRRLWAMPLAAAPLGLGFVWTLLDNDRLGWHDRISQIYLREY